MTASLGRRMQDEPNPNSRKTPWPHAPLHQLSHSGTFFVTVGTYRKQHFFRSCERIQVLHRGLLTVTRDFGWRMEAWAVFSNHYHFVAHSPVDEPGASTLPRMLGSLHEKTAKWINGLDRMSGRKVWHNYRETRLTYEKSYLARLKYTHLNAVHHGLVLVANQYRWCSAAWFERSTKPAQVKTIYNFEIDRLKVNDDFEVPVDAPT